MSSCSDRDIKVGMMQPDLDYDAALANMAGMADLYQEALLAFWAEAPSLMQQYQQQLAAANWAEARRAAHSLKSAAAVIGAPRLSEAARELEKLARDEEADACCQQAAWEACVQAWQAFAEQARHYLPA